MKKLLRFMTCGSVDDGKSTLIGRLLYDAHLLYEDQVKELEKEKQLEYANLLDGLQDERSQGITIDVAYRYFSTDKRSFIVADTPGHEQYTRNMAVGASFASLAILLIDAYKGVTDQTLRHVKIAKMMGIDYFVFAINKMDLVDYSEDVFNNISNILLDIAKQIKIENVKLIPLSGLNGDNIIIKSEKMKWYNGETLLEYLENVDVDKKREDSSFILPVQRVCRKSDYRGYEGQIVDGQIKIDDEVEVLPQHEKVRVSSILTAGKSSESAYIGQPVSISFNKEIDVSRGDVIVKDNPLSVIDNFKAKIIWFSDDYLKQGLTCYLKLSTQMATVKISNIISKDDLNTLGEINERKINKNDIATIEIISFRKLICTDFDRVPEMGRFLLIDRISNETLACGIIEDVNLNNNLTYQNTSITRKMRSDLLHQKPVTIWFTGLSGAGKSALADALEKKLHNMSNLTMILDGDNIRMGLNKDLRFSDSDRTENIRRISEVSKLMNDAGIIVLTAFISPFNADRKLAKSIIGTDNFFEVYVDTPLEICEERDAKGLYEKARKGIIKDFTGISSPYEKPENPDFRIDMSKYSIEEGANLLLDELIRKGYLV